jgi:two-component system NarL family sensor kinase
MREDECSQAHAVFPFLQMNAETSATYLRALIDCGPIALVVLDAQHRYAMCNAAFVKLFQYTSEELCGSGIDELIAEPGMLEQAASLTQRVLQGHRIHSVAQRRRRDGVTVDVEIYGIPLIVDGDLVGVYALYQDVTERNRAQRALRQMSGQIEDAQQKERYQIARDLHDSTAQELAVLNWNLTRLDNMVRDAGEPLRELVRDTRDIALQCSSRIRSASYLLHPPLLGEMGLVPALVSLVDGFEQRSGILVMMDVGPDLKRFSDEVEIATFRIVQEALANVLRHSGSPRARVSLQGHDSWLVLEVSDQGKRKSPTLRETNVVGVGICGMRERVEQLGGYFRIDFTGNGTTVVAVLPMRISPDA